MENWTLTWTKLTLLSKGNVDAINAKLSGVYRLSYKSNDGNYYVFYVGKAEGITQRLSEHMTDSEINVCIKNQISTKDCYFRYAIVTKDYIREAAEKQMYKQYEPSCNEKVPEGRDDVKVNLD